MVVVRASSSECIHPDERNPSFNGNSNLNTTGTNFEALLEDIDRESSHDGKESDPVVIKIIKEIKKDDTKMDDSDNAVLTEKSMSKCLKLEANQVSNPVDNGRGSGSFTMGWAKPKIKNKSLKKPKETGGGGSLIEGRQDRSGQDASKESKKGCWTRLLNRPPTAGDHDICETDVGPKRKFSTVNNLDGEGCEQQKKLKLEEETRILGSLFATRLGAAEVAKQPRQAQ